MLNPRGAAANVSYVQTLVDGRKLPYASTVKRVRADGDIIVVSSTLMNPTNARELWEGLSLALGCDDSFLSIRGYSDSASRHHDMLRSTPVNVPHVGVSIDEIGFVRQPPLA